MLFLKGFIIGLLMLVPGLSGGSIAVGLGIYEEILAKSTHFFKNLKANFFYFLTLIIGGIVGAFISSFTILALAKYNGNIIYFVMIIVMSFIVVRHFKSYYRKVKWWQYSFFIFGIMILYLFNNYLTINISNEFLKLLVAGILLAIAFILPGISFSYVLVILNLYSDVLLAITNFDYLFILKIGGCFILGIILTIKLIDSLFRRYPNQTNNTILGFVVASVISYITIDNLIISILIISITSIIAIKTK